MSLSYLLIRVRRDTSPNNDNTKVWPLSRRQINSLQGLQRGPKIYDLGHERGLDVEEVLCAVPSSVASAFTEAPAVRELSRDEAAEWLSACPNPLLDITEVVTDPGRLEIVKARAAVGSLRGEDEAALDPDDPTPGVKRVNRRSLDELFPDGS